jgi:uncharacterized membrane protein (UPF0127 family)
VLAALAAIGVAAHASERLPLVVGGHALTAEVAATPQQRQRGLTGRTELPADSGMLFVFEQADRHCFWMRDTPLPLTLAFIDAGGRVIELADMQPRTDTRHCSATAVRYALEVVQARSRPWLAPGAQVEGLPR